MFLHFRYKLQLQFIAFFNVMKIAHLWFLCNVAFCDYSHRFRAIVFCEYLHRIKERDCVVDLGYTQ